MSFDCQETINLLNLKRTARANGTFPMVEMCYKQEALFKIIGKIRMKAITQVNKLISLMYASVDNINSDEKQEYNS